MTENNKYVMIFIVTVLSIIGYFLPVSIQWLGIKDLLNSCVFFCVGMIVKTLDFKKRRVPYVIKCGIGIVVSIIIFQNVPKNKSTFLRKVMEILLRIKKILLNMMFPKVHHFVMQLL